MDSQGFKKSARILREAWKELEQIALNEKVDIFGSDFKLVKDRVREKVLEKMGSSVEEYKEAKANYLKERAVHNPPSTQNA